MRISQNYGLLLIAMFSDSEEQATSYEAQIEYYTEYIQKNPEWELAGIFADEDLSGTDTRKCGGLTA